jgi:hypothetical protein
MEGSGTRIQPGASAPDEADLLAGVLHLAHEQLVRPRDLLAQVEQQEPPGAEPRSIEVASDLVERLGMSGRPSSANLWAEIAVTAAAQSAGTLSNASRVY